VDGFQFAVDGFRFAREVTKGRQGQRALFVVFLANSHAAKSALPGIGGAAPATTTFGCLQFVHLLFL
jgi:hypothetical protein